MTAKLGQELGCHTNLFQQFGCMKKWYSLVSFLFFVFFSFYLVSCHSPKQKKATKPSQVSFVAVGDLMVHKSQLRYAYRSACDCYQFSHLFDEVRDYIATADFAIGNLETTLPGDHEKEKNKNYSGYPRFGTPDSFVEELVRTGFDILTTANNHSVDKNRAGILRTIKVLKEKGLQHLGTYKSQQDYQENRVLVVEKNHLKIGLLNYTYGTNGIPVPKDVVVNLIDKEKIKADLQYAHQLSLDAVIVLFHFGAEYTRYPNAFQKEMTKLAFDYGANVVLGSHPHVLQPYQIVRTTDIYGETKDRLVIYSLGNFVSGQQRRYTDGGTIFQFTIRKENDTLRFVRVNDIPVWVHFDSNKRKIRVLPAQIYVEEKFQKLSKKALGKLKVFYKDTTTHYQKSREDLKHYNNMN